MRLRPTASLVACGLAIACSNRPSPTPQATAPAPGVASTQPSATAPPRPTTPPVAAAAPSASSAPAPAPSAAATPPSTAGNLTFAARHDGFHDAWVVGEKLVLVGCRRLRVLDTDLDKGRDVPAPDVSDKSCQSLVVGVRDGALLARGLPGAKGAESHGRAVDIETGQGRDVPAVAPDAGAGGADQGAASYNRDDAGVVHLARQRRAGYEVWPLAVGKDSVFSYGPDGLVRAADAATGRVVWEYGTGLAVRGDEENARPPVVWNMKGQEILVARSRSVKGHDGMIVFRHGDAPAPLWTGTVRGHAKGAGFSVEGNGVHAAGRSGVLDAKGGFSLPVATRGTMLVVGDPCGAGCDLSTEAVDVDPAHGPYTVDLKVKVFQQGCR